MASGMVFRAQIAGATQAARDLKGAARRMRSELISEFRSHADELTLPFIDAAPYDAQGRDDYHLIDHITARVVAGPRVQAIVDVEAISPLNGFDYLNVTRFGHRGTLRPTHRRYMKWEQYGRTVFAKESAGSHPGSDWVEDARPEGDAVAGELADRIGRAVLTRLF